jgi:hypothetical protein
MVGAIVVLVAAAAAVAVPSRPRLQVDVHVDAGVPLDRDDLRAIASGVKQIWAPVLDLAVSLPGEARRPGATDSLRLVVTNRTLTASDVTGLGWIDFVDGEPQREITVSVAAARRLLTGGTWAGTPFSALPPRASRLFLQRCLARAVAHEVGHFLLRSRTHEPRGLMRPVFTIDQIMNGRNDLTALTREQMDAIRGNGALYAERGGGGGSRSAEAGPTTAFTSP